MKNSMNTSKFTLISGEIDLTSTLPPYSAMLKFERGNCNGSHTVS